MTDAERVAAIDRDAELALLPQLLEEARRPVPAPPERINVDPRLLHDVMVLLASTYPEHNRLRKVA